MRREVIAAIVVGVAALGMGLFSITQERNRERYTDSLIVDPREDLVGEEPSAGSGTVARDRWRGSSPPPSSRSGSSTASRPRPRTGYGMVTAPAGTGVPVRLSTTISSEEAQVGDTWSGVVTDGVYADGRLVIPAGSTVSGTVVAVRPAERGDRAMLQLGISRVHVGGRSYRARGGSEPVIAGSPRARNLGAIAGGAAAGALLGKAVSGSNKGAAIGGVVGGTVAGAAVAKSKGWQVVLKGGTEMTFTLRQSVSVSKAAVNNHVASN